MANETGEGERPTQPGASSWVTQLWVKVQEKAVERIASTIVLGAAAVAALAATATWAALKHWVIIPGIPAGAVMAFVTECSKQPGWSSFLEGTGRCIVGAGDKYAPGYENWHRDVGDGKTQEIPLKNTSFAPMHPDGEVTHQLTILQLPPHDHPIQILQHSEYQRSNQGYPALESVGRDGSKADPKGAVRYTEMIGGGQHFNVMPPFIALYFCKKDP
jgi:hypothetical protein